MYAASDITSTDSSCAVRYIGASKLATLVCELLIASNDWARPGQVFGMNTNAITASHQPGTGPPRSAAFAILGVGTGGISFSPHRKVWVGNRKKDLFLSCRRPKRSRRRSVKKPKIESGERDVTS